MKSKLTIVIVVLIAIVVIILIANKKIKIEDNNIKSLYFSYSTGNMMNSYVIYEIDQTEGKYTLSIKPDKEPEDSIIKKELDEEDINKLVSALNKYKVNTWNNFHEGNKSVLDGDSFLFELETTEGKVLSASGYMNWPKNYDKVKAFFELHYNN